MLKTRFPFLYASTSLDTKALIIASNRNFESCLSILCLAPQHIFRFFQFGAGISFASGNFALYCVVLLNAPLSDRDQKKKKMCLQYTLLFPGNLDPSSLTPGDPIVLLVCGFRRRDILLAWRELFANLYELKSRIWFWGNTTTLSEFIRYIDLTGFRQISSEYPRNNGKRKCVGECWYFKYLSRGIHLRNTTSTFFATPTLDANISINNQNIEQAWHTFVDWCLVNKTVQPACAVASETR